MLENRNKQYLKISGALLLLLCIVSFVSLFFYVALDSEIAGKLIDCIAVTGKILLLLTPIPILILNLRNGLISWLRFGFALLVLLLLAWRFFLA